MKNTKRILSLLLCMALILGIVPVFASAAGETYTKVTAAAEITSGKYVMINAAGYAPGVLDGTWVTAVQPTVDGDSVTDAAGAVVTLTVDGTSVKIQDANGAYIAPKSGNTNGIQSAEYAWDMVVAADATVQFKGVGTDTTILASNKGSSYKFRAYKTTTATNETNYPTIFTLYKLAEAADPDVPVCEHANLSENAIHIESKHVNECADCGEAITSKDYTVSVVFDENGHNEACTCGYAAPAVSHAMSDWVVTTPATAAAPGVETKTCSGCAYTLTQEIAQLPVTGNHYIKVSGNLLSGTYILVAGDYAMGAFNNGWILNTTAPVIDENTVADDLGGVWTLTVTDTGVMLTDANGITVAPKAGNNNGILSGDYNWAYTYDEATGTYSFAGVGTDTTILALNTDIQNGLNRFRAYKTTTLEADTKGTYISAFTLYKLEGEVSCDHDIVYTTTETTHISSCSKCQEVFVEESFHDLKGENGTCSICNIPVDADALTAAWLELLFNLEPGATLDGNFMLTGTVTEINYTFDTSYKNMSVTIAIEGYENTVYCYRMKCTADQAAAMYVGAVITVEGPFENYNGTYEIKAGTLISMVPCEHEYDNTCDADCNVCGATRDAGHVYDDNCDTDCNVCGEWRSAPHNLGESVAAVIPANCTETGHDEYWICADCGCYFMSDGMGGYYETNPAWINYPGEHVRPEGAAGCAVVACELCGEDSFGTDSCVRPENAPACQEATCVNCGGTIFGEGHSYGYDEETWEPLSPLCQPGDCIYCGEHLEYIYECENGSYAPCSVDGECVYGCGKQFPATGVHALDNPCEGGLCWQCWTEIEPAHNLVDGVCSICAFDANLKFNAAPGLSFKDYIGMQILVSSGVANGYDRVWIEAVQADPAGDVTTILEGVPYYYNIYLKFEQQVLSWSMAENITLTLYAEKNGVTVKGETFSGSVEELALAKIADYAAASNTKAVTALVDMLNYGAAVQTSFNHYPDMLPNTNLGEYTGTTATPAFNATNEIAGTGTLSVASNSISMQAKVEIQLLIMGKIDGYTVSAKVGGADAPVVIDTQKYAAYGWTLVKVAVAADKMRDVYTISINDANGNPVTPVYNVSVEAYGAGQLDGAKADVVIAMMRYGDSVAAL